MQVVWSYLLHRTELLSKLYHFTQELTCEILKFSEDECYAIVLGTCSGAYHSNGGFLFFPHWKLSLLCLLEDSGFAFL